MKLPDKIIKFRKENGWSQEDLAEKLDVSRQSISRWEMEQHYLMLKMYCRLVNCSMLQLIIC